MLKLLLILLVFTAGAYARCEESDQIQCRTNDKCTRISYVCDGDNDCGDYSDEDADLCKAWRNDDCPRGEVLCRRDGATYCKSIRAYCRSDPPCDGDLDRRLCKMLDDELLQILADVVLPADMRESQEGGAPIQRDLNETFVKANDFMDLVPHSLKHDDCPQFYTKIGDECLSLFFNGNMTWGEATKFCEVIDGHLYQPKSDEHFDILTYHLRNHAFEADFWVGGNFYNNTIGWRWLDEKPIQLKTNHWALVHEPECYSRDVYHEYRDGHVVAKDGVCYNYYQAPFVSNPLGSCVAMTYKRFYFLSDEDCNLRKGPICQHN